MAQVIWTEPALENLNDIAEYIAVSAPDAAARLVARVFDQVQRLEVFPESGKVPCEVDDLNYREAIVNPLRIFYKVALDRVYVLLVLRQERDLRRYLLEH